MTDDPFVPSWGDPEDDRPLDEAEERAFGALSEGLSDVNDVPPSEAEARAYLGDDAYEKMAAFNDASNTFTLLANSAAIELTRSKAKMWRAVAFGLRIGALAGIAALIDWLVR